MSADWQLISRSTGGDTYYMDFTSVAQVGAFRKAWVQVSLANPSDTNDYPKKKYQSARYLYYFDCKAKSTSSFQHVKYAERYADGEVVSTSSIKFDPKDLDDVVPDTVGETFLQVACASDGGRSKIKARNAATIASILKAVRLEREAEEAAAAKAPPDDSN